jgi:transposase
VALVLGLYAEVLSLQERVAALEAAAGGGLPPANSRNSSQPPSRDQKAKLPEPKNTKRVGARRGHEAAFRPLVENPDKLIEVKAEQCTNCHTDLRAVPAQRVLRHQLTELPIMRPFVIETRIHEVECPTCHTCQRGVPPVGLEAMREFGPQLEATVVYYKQEQHLSYERIVETMRDLWRVRLSEGGINAILRRAATAAQTPATHIGAAVARSAMIGSDETSVRVGGETWWQWVFRSAAGIFHQIVPKREGAVVLDFMDEQCAEFWVSDCYGAQLQAPTKGRQICLAHQIRDLERVIEQDATLVWPVEMQALFQEAIHLRNRFVEQQALTPTGYQRRVTELENRLDTLLTQDQSGTAAEKLFNRYVKHRDHLLTFLHHTEVPPTNNACEQSLRASVIHRKVTNGFRSQWAAKGYAALASVIQTAELQGRRAFEVLVELMGVPVLPFLDTSDP